MPSKNTNNPLSLNPVMPMMVTGNRTSKKKIPSPVVLIDTLAKYLKWCEKEQRRPTKQGYSVAMDFSSPKTLNQWCKRNNGKISSYEESLFRAYTIIEDICVNVLTDPNNRNGNGMFRYMQNAYGYRDKVDSVSNETHRITRLPAKKAPGSPVETDFKKAKRGKKKKGAQDKVLKKTEGKK